MKYSDITKLKHLAQDKTSRSANPAIVRNSTIFFKSMQELLDKEKLVKKGSKVNFYEYGRGGSQTTIALQNFIAELECYLSNINWFWCSCFSNNEYM